MPGRLVWVNGHPTSGKTWMGNYLEQQHGFRHIDGDEDLHRHGIGGGDLALKVVVGGFWSHIKKHVMQGKGPGPRELWQPYYNRIVARTKDLRRAQPDADIVVSFCAYSRVVRDFIRMKIGEPVTFLALVVARDEFVGSQVARIKEHIQEEKMSEAEVFEQLCPGEPYVGETSLHMYCVQMSTSLLDTLEQSDDHAAIVPTKDRSQIAPVVETVLGLPRLEDGSATQAKHDVCDSCNAEPAHHIALSAGFRGGA